MKIFFLFFFLLGQSAFCQNELSDLDFLLTQRSYGSPFSLPIFISPKGEISLEGKGKGITFRPDLQAGLNRTDIEYSHPILMNDFNFYPAQKELGVIEIRRRWIEYGAGISTLIQSTTSLGLVPYKGSMQTITQYKDSKEEESHSLKLPAELFELQNWRQRDRGVFQTYGGIQTYAGLGIDIVDIGRLSLGIQNQFIVEIEKLSEDKIRLKISEENLKRRDLKLGPFISDLTLGRFSGKVFSSEFELHLLNPQHEALYREALSGNLKLLQDTLSSKEQKITWEGKDRHLYLGIPVIAGKIISSASYTFVENGVETELDFRGSKNRGFLTPHRLHRDYAYHTDEDLIVIWSSEMNKTDASALNKRFISRGKIMGVKGFKKEVPKDMKFGSVISQIGIHLSRKEFEALRDIDLKTVITHLQKRCHEFHLSCRSEKKIERISRKIKELLKKPWEKTSGKLGVFLLKEPAVIYAVIKTMNYKKEVFFKFLSEKSQSLEGSSPVEI